MMTADIVAPIKFLNASIFFTFVIVLRGHVVKLLELYTSSIIQLLAKNYTIASNTSNIYQCLKLQL